jgi:hypothetical protein
MCEINPKYARYFKLEAFCSPASDMTEEEFEQEVLKRTFDAEQALNADGRFRFHVHEDHPFRRSP